MQAPPAPTGSGATPERAGLPLLRQSREDCHQLDVSLTREWVEADGLGGYASSTVPLCPTRRQHGLLVAQPPGSVRRHVFLGRLDETLAGPEVAAGAERSLALGTARYPGVFQPQGHLGCEGFELAPWPRWTYRLGLARVTREILVPRGLRAVLVRYTNTGERAGLSLRLRPLLPYREADRLTFENFDFDQRARRRGAAVAFQPYPGLPQVAFTMAGATARFEADPVWYRRIEYTQDLAQGFDCHEDNASPGWFELPLPIGAEVVLAVALGEGVEDPEGLWEAESARRLAEVAALGGEPGRELDLGARLDLAAEAFLYRDGTGRTGVIAGYPWYGERSRDTALALPGLTAARGRTEALGAALEGLAAELRAGCLPERLGAGAEGPRRDSADAALWFARAARHYEQAGGDAERFDGVLLPALESIAHAYLDGASTRVRADAAGLLVLAPPGLAPALAMLLASVLIVTLFNWRGRLFLGDAGAYAGAALVGFVAILLYNEGVAVGMTAGTAVTWFLIPVLDCLRLAVRRARDGRSPFAADRDHLHHRLEHRFGRRRAVLIYWTIVAIPVGLTLPEAVSGSLAVALPAALYIVVLRLSAPIAAARGERELRHTMSPSPSVSAKR